MKASSPVEKDDLLEYVSWHIFLKSSKTSDFDDARSKLNARGYDLQTIQNWKNVDEAHWDRLDILLGIDIQLARDVSKFARWKRAGDVSSSLHRPEASSPSSEQV